MGDTTLNILLSDWDYLEIAIRQYTDRYETKYIAKCSDISAPQGNGVYINGFAQRDSGGRCVARYFANSGGKLFFTSGLSNNSGATNVMVPVAVYGIKGKI